MNRLCFLIVAFIFVATIASGAAPGSISRIDVSNGIDESEAFLIAEAYFYAYISGCGYPAEPINAGDNWVSKTYIGIAGQPGPPILVNKATGRITWKDNTSTVEELEGAESNQYIQRHKEAMQ